MHLRRLVANDAAAPAAQTAAADNTARTTEQRAAHTAAKAPNTDAAPHAAADPTVEDAQFEATHTEGKRQATIAQAQLASLRRQTGCLTKRPPSPRWGQPPETPAAETAPRPDHLPPATVDQQQPAQTIGGGTDLETENRQPRRPLATSNSPHSSRPRHSTDHRPPPTPTVSTSLESAPTSPSCKPFQLTRSSPKRLSSS